VKCAKCGLNEAARGMLQCDGCLGTMYRCVTDIVRGFPCPTCEVAKGQDCLLRPGEPLLAMIHQSRWSLATGLSRYGRVEVTDATTRPAL
jgi:hypothetical protein